jgi:N-acetylglucosamine-6-phosphate deacetylase
MSQQLTLEISDEVYADLQRKANAVGVSITEWIVTVLSRQGETVARVTLSPEQQEQVRQKFKSHAGAISLGHATGSDNQAIDADLARAYADEY